MSINSVSASSVAAQPTGTSPSLKNALSSSLDVASSLTLMMNALLQNVLKSAQQQPGLGTPGMGAPGIGGPTQPGANGLGGLLQSLTQLLSALTPLLQALTGGMGANPNAMQFANQLPGAGMGIGPQIRPQMPQQFPTQMGMPGNNLMGVGPSLPNALGAAGGTLGGLAGGAVAGPVGASVGSTLGSAAGTVAGTALASELGVPTTGMPGGLTSVNTPAQFGGMSREAALGWAVMNGGPNMQANDITQGMNLYSIFNSGNRMF